MAKLKSKPNNIDIISIAFDTTVNSLVGLGKNGLTYFYDKSQSAWFKY
jgi:hypothetical protein